MQQLLPTLRGTPIGFAHRGARDRAPENTVDAFAVALELGATGLESDVWVTVDGCAVLDHDGTVRRGLRSRRISEVHRDELPPHIPDLTTVLGMTGVATHLSLDIKDTDALPSVVAAIAASGVDPARVWLCSPDLGFLLELTAAMPVVRAVHSTRVRSLDVSLEKHCSLLSESGVAALNLHHSEWTGGMTTLAHRFGLHAFAWDIQYPEQMVNILRMGMDAVYSDHADMMMRCIGDING